MFRNLRIIFSSVLFIIVSLVLFYFLGEVAARIIEGKSRSQGKIEFIPDETMGWLPSLGRATVTTNEYRAVYDINAYGMNDRPIEESVNIAKLRIMAVGDSHTFAIGASQEEAWPKVLEKMLFAGNMKEGVVYNCAVPGYNLGQYLLQMRRMQDVLRPQIIIIGFSMASDLYDLMPPRYGAVEYWSELIRVYFDLDKNGGLIECRNPKGKGSAEPENKKKSFMIRCKKVLHRHSRLYQRLKKSKLAMWIFIHLNPQLWPGQDTVLKRTPDAQDLYRWKLAQEILIKIAREAGEKGRKVILVNIPYLPQVYEDIWKISFGKFPKKYDRWIGSQRLKDICLRAGIQFIDTTPAFIQEIAQEHQWLHYRGDWHPTKRGQELIAGEVYKQFFQ